jgi:hypothetical protein
MDLGHHAAPPPPPPPDDGRGPAPPEPRLPLTIEYKHTFFGRMGYSLHMARYRHQELKKKIHESRMPLSKRGIRFMSFVYFTAPLVVGYVCLHASNWYSERKFDGSDKPEITERQQDFRRGMSKSEPSLQALRSIELMVRREQVHKSRPAAERKAAEAAANPTGMSPWLEKNPNNIFMPHLESRTVATAPIYYKDGLPVTAVAASSKLVKSSSLKSSKSSGKGSIKQLPQTAAVAGDSIDSGSSSSGSNSYVSYVNPAAWYQWYYSSTSPSSSSSSSASSSASSSSPSASSSPTPAALSTPQGEGGRMRKKDKE